MIPSYQPGRPSLDKCFVVIPVKTGSWICRLHCTLHCVLALMGCWNSYKQCTVAIF